MSAPSSREVTGLLQAWGRGDEEALQKLIPLVYEELHAAAGRYMARERLRERALVGTAILIQREMATLLRGARSVVHELSP